MMKTNMDIQLEGLGVAYKNLSGHREYVLICSVKVLFKPILVTLLNVSMNFERDMKKITRD